MGRGTFFGIEDLILLLDVSSLKVGEDEDKKVQLGGTMGDAWPSPNFSDQIVDGVPGNRTVSD